MPDEYISRETALKDFESCNAENPNWTPQRVKTLLLRQPAADVAEDFKAVLHEVQPEISDVLVPNCVYRCGCPEMQTCGMYEWWLKFHPDIASTDIQKRYNTYNELFWKVRAKRGNDSGN